MVIENTPPADQYVEQRPDIEALVMKSLSQTPYRCLSLERLYGGYSNLTFRGILHSPLPDGQTSVIVKHLITHSNADLFDAPECRCASGDKSLEMMHDVLFQHGNVLIRTPAHLYCDTDAKVGVMEDVPNHGTLREYFDLNPGIDKSTALTIGESLGQWLSEFHSRDWSHLDDESAAPFIQNQTTMRESKAIFEFLMDSFHDDSLARESIIKVFSEDDSCQSLIHGDFSGRNSLVQSDSPGKDPNAINITIIDWEMCRFGCSSVDLGSMISSIYIQWRFDGTPSAKFLLNGFIRGYGQVSDHVALRTVALIAVYILLWEKVGGRIPGESRRSQVPGVRDYGRDLLIRAAQGDVKWVSESFLGALLKDRTE
ncbi:hypothetical protein P170DRAFT_472229 [Aspergillus steynii IBT 23096]|uniref:Aminoglycoside phosphotransferase domain-containing protein n=1 Tax=Aspergillus steynii IBT 23096 TaxID=1392250 RepID=A0A2I2GHG8_9EURO|nr:uncharacterized protein P170DRAFT_472229 [Aspergillus steynii IBT 23096]PLB52326.1 hypothetical protein P170DRAFT_472229 [Aspergillus steynii IBT 23096]